MLRVSVAARPLSLLQPTSARQLPHCRRAASSAAPAAAASLEELLQQHRIAPSAPLAADALGRLPSRLAFLQGLGVPDAAVAAVVRRNPSVLSTEPQALSPGLDYLLSLGVADLGGSVRRAPDLLGCSVRRDLGLKVAILQSLGVRDIARYLSRNPRLVSIDVERQMRPAVGRVLEQLPTVGLNAEAIAPRIEYYRSLGVPRLGRFLSRHPPLLAYSLEANVQPKVAWLKEQGFGDVPTLLSRSVGLLPRQIGDIEHFPRILNYSVEHLTLRHDFLAAAGKAGAHGLTRTYRSSPHTFATKLAKRSLDEFEAFVARRASTRGPHRRAADAFLARYEGEGAKDDQRRAAVAAARSRLDGLLEAARKAAPAIRLSFPPLSVLSRAKQYLQCQCAPKAKRQNPVPFVPSCAVEKSFSGIVSELACAAEGGGVHGAKCLAVLAGVA
ncbi:hypothetical protein EMIHUDRAFT_448827 [Emiliania huxleyi CCMP1516]|uniref:Uncharacterized protein n=2 Tax=Emiliania huxleyi TaxID=2903 RepID=A0A0D3KUM6_EMIH1|nr:hypothetical protein EMIHUDRAFT_448827 [Emiliania huxleyi CCMP1516]EOD39461.1 hypothetical protein EMIHUDRAFT_448827 [Emiliania huxleyi CCMP1516]|eukprot:XP_005791890.1 hypothetical protein EMIHUDRAFT_448827 [Emiliania huxleyi CCMP1516]